MATDAKAQTEQAGPHKTGGIFTHAPHLHLPRNVNALIKTEQELEGANTKIAIGLTKSVGSMWTAYSFAVLAVIGLFAILGWFPPIVVLLVSWTSQTLIQLVLLPVIMVGQNVLGRKAELQADEQFNTTMSTYHDIEQIMQHLSAQDDELLKQTKMLVELLQTAGAAGPQGTAGPQADAADGTPKG